MEGTGGAITADAVVALDGGGGAYTTIAAAIAAAPRSSSKRYTIYVKKGIYKLTEPVTVDADVWNLTLVGDGIDVTTISGDWSVEGGHPTYQSGTLRVLGQGFIAHDLTVKNTAGAAKEQAVAFMSESERSVLYRCAIKGYQDTLYAKKNTQFYHECQIQGTVDFIFSNATAAFHDCAIVARLPSKDQQNTITAQARGVGGSVASGFSFLSCTISASDELAHAGYAVETYLGRPWDVYSRVVFMGCNMSQVVNPKGWLRWNNDPHVDQLYYGEYENTGKGSGVGGRVNWPGYHVIKDVAEAAKFTVHNFIQGDEWLPATGVKYDTSRGSDSIVDAYISIIT